MAIKLYDDALYKKIQKWVKDPNMRILKPEEVTRMFQVNADLRNDAPLKLPIIALARDPEFDIKSANKKPMSYDGMMLESNGTRTLQFNAIPIEIRYQIDIYTKYYEEGDEYLRNFIFNIVNSPRFDVVVPYNDRNEVHKGTMTLVPTISDNSDIAQRLFPGQFTRWTIKFIVEDAYLFSLPYVANVAMSDENEIEIVDKN